MNSLFHMLVMFTNIKKMVHFFKQVEMYIVKLLLPFIRLYMYFFYAKGTLTR